MGSEVWTQTLETVKRIEEIEYFQKSFEVVWFLKILLSPVHPSLMILSWLSPHFTVINFLGICLSNTLETLMAETVPSVSPAHSTEPDTLYVVTTCFVNEWVSEWKKAFTEWLP